MSLMMSWALLRNRKPTRKCSSCGLRYAADLDDCPHCSSLSLTQLHQLKQRLEHDRNRSLRMGRELLTGAAVLAGLFILWLLYT